MRDPLSMLESFVNSMGVATPEAVSKYARRIGAGRVTRDVLARIGKPVVVRVSIPGYGSRSVRLVASKRVRIGELLDRASELISGCLGHRVVGDGREMALDVLLSNPTILAHEHSRRIMYKLFTDRVVPEDPLAPAVMGWLVPFIELNGGRLVGGDPRGLVSHLSASLVPVVKCLVNASKGRGRVRVLMETAVRMGAARSEGGRIIVTKYGMSDLGWLYVPVDESVSREGRHVTIAYVERGADAWLVGTLPKPLMIVIR